MKRSDLLWPATFALIAVAACDNPADPTDPPTELPLIRMNPFRTPAGGGDLDIEVDGLDFTNGSTVHWDGSPRTTAFVSDSQLSVTISASDLAPPRTVSITVVGSTGAATNPLPFFIDATEVQPRFAYLLNRPEGISAYRVDSETGTLDPIVGFRPPNVGGFERPFVSDPTGRFIYVGGAEAIAWLRVDSATGILTHLGSLASQGFLSTIAMDPAGQHLFAILGERELVGEELLAYPIDPSTGSLPAAPISRIAAQGSGLAVEPSGRFLYTTNTFRLNPEAGIHAFEFNRATGELVHLGFHSTDMAAVNAVAADRRGERLFVSTQSGLSRGNLVGYDIDPLAGTLSESVGNIELREPTFGIAVHPSSESNGVHRRPGMLEGSTTLPTVKAQTRPSPSFPRAYPRPKTVSREGSAGVSA